MFGGLKGVAKTLAKIYEMRGRFNTVAKALGKPRAADVHLFGRGSSLASKCFPKNQHLEAFCSVNQHSIESLQAIPKPLPNYEVLKFIHPL